MSWKLCLLAAGLAGAAAPSFAGEGSLPIPSNCVRFEACVDGSDYVGVAGGHLTVTHLSWDLMGRNNACEGLKAFSNLSVSLYHEGTGGFAVSGDPVADATGATSVPTSITTLNSFHFIYGRGTVVLDPDNAHQVLITDTSADGTVGYGGAGHYIVDLCQ